MNKTHHSWKSSGHGSLAHICVVTRGWHDSCIYEYVTSLMAVKSGHGSLPICGDSIIYDMACAFVTWLVGDMTHAYMNTSCHSWQSKVDMAHWLIYVWWLVGDMTHAHMNTSHHSWLSKMDMAHWIIYESWLVHVWHDSWVTCLMHIWIRHVTHGSPKWTWLIGSYMCGDSIIHVLTRSFVTWLVGDMTHAYTNETRHVTDGSQKWTWLIGSCMCRDVFMYDMARSFVTWLVGEMTHTYKNTSRYSLQSKVDMAHWLIYVWCMVHLWHDFWVIWPRACRQVCVCACVVMYIMCVCVCVYLCIHTHIPTRGQIRWEGADCTAVALNFELSPS